MGEELNKPEKNYSPIDKENIYLKFGFNQVQGWKKSMEDYAIEFLDSGEKKFMNIFGIFDGHGGKEVPRYLQAHFLECLNKNNNFNTEKYKDGITETFFELDKNFTTKEAQEELAKYSEEFKPEKDKELKEINDLCSPNEKLSNEELEQVMAFNEVFDPRNIENANIAEFTGATGMILAICYKDILIAYAGNSRCLILDAEGKIINQTTDHTIKSANEKKRVDLARSFNDEDEEKKKGEDEHMEYLDSTRGFGDLEFKGNEWIEPILCKVQKSDPLSEVSNNYDATIQDPMENMEIQRYVNSCVYDPEYIARESDYNFLDCIEKINCQGSVKALLIDFYNTPLKQAQKIWQKLAFKYFNISKCLENLGNSASQEEWQTRLKEQLSHFEFLEKDIVEDANRFYRFAQLMTLESMIWLANSKIDQPEKSLQLKSYLYEFRDSFLGR